MHKVVNMSTNFSNESSSPQTVACDVYFDHSFPVKIVKILLYSIILLTSLVGNVLIITIERYSYSGTSGALSNIKLLFKIL